MTKLGCPTCKRVFDSEKTRAMPFCSERCREVDLGRWLDERNAMSDPTDEQESAAETDEGARADSGEAPRK